MKKSVLILSLVGIFAMNGTAIAAPFPEKTGEVVQDAKGFLNSEDRERFQQTVQKLPEEYKVVVVESIRPEAETPDEYAQKLYDNYNLSENTLMIVLDMETGELGVHAGPAVAEKGADPDMLHEKIKTYYEPFRMQSEHMKGIELFVTEVDAELNLSSADGQANGSAAGAGAGLPATGTADEQSSSFWAGIPWWLYLTGIGLAGALTASTVLFSRRRTVYGEIDDLEDAKDGLVEKIQLLEVSKPLRRASGATEERYAELANRKENLLRIRVPDVEMIILESEEAASRFRFGMARGLLAEGWELLESIEREMEELKEEIQKVEQAKKENRTVLPEIGRTVEALERKLSHFRLEYGMPFHQLKSQLDELDKLRGGIKTALADGDGLRAHELSAQAQALADKLASALERVPALVAQVTKEMPAELKQLEDDIAAALGDGFDLNQNYLDASLLQVKQLLIAATTALEEGDADLVDTHCRAFAVKVDAVYDAMEECALNRREAAAAQAPHPAVPDEPAKASWAAESSGVQEAVITREAAADELASAEPTATLESALQPEVDHSGPELYQEQKAVTTAPEADERVEGDVFDQAAGHREQAERWPEPAADPQEPEALDGEPAAASFPAKADVPSGEEWGISPAERESLLGNRSGAAPLDSAGREWTAPSGMEKAEEALRQAGDSTQPAFPDEPEIPSAGADETGVAPEHSGLNEPEDDPEELALELVIENEDDALDEMERISQSLLRIRQKIRRSYLPGVPDAVKMHFDQVVQALAQTKRAMEEFGYEWHEIALLLKEAHELLAETERVTEQIIATCQRAEGAIQYTNRYRRVNRRVNELLIHAEQSFRQLRFEEALYLAEKARLIVEGEVDGRAEGSRWRRKQKGADA